MSETVIFFHFKWEGWGRVWKMFEGLFKVGEINLVKIDTLKKVRVENHQQYLLTAGKSSLL